MIQHYLVQKPSTLESFYSENELESFYSLDYLLELGAIYKNGKRILNKNEALIEGDYLRIHKTPRRYPAYKEVDLSKLILVENADFVLVNKPSGLPVHATLDNQRENLLSILQEKFGEEVYITHRLDIETSGLMIYARNKIFQREFNLLLTQRRVNKYYLASSTGQAPLGIQTHYMDKDKRSPKRIFAHPGEERILCELDVMSAKHDGELTHHRIRLITGRTHQIRAQLAFLGAPILGDHLYGGKDNSIFGLKCSELSFPYGGSLFLHKLD